MSSWIFLIVGGIGAVGAAMAIGTAAAWVRFRRTGELPGDDGGAAPEDAGRRLVVRVVVGVVVAVVAALVLADQGLLSGPMQ